MKTWTNGAAWNSNETIPDDFFGLYSEIYRELLPNAPVENEPFIRTLFSPSHGYFAQGQVWLALRPNQIRLCGFIHPSVTSQGKKVGYFGFWETRNDLNLNRELFAELEAWMKSKGVEVMVGPVNFSPFVHYRLREEPLKTDDIFIAESFNPDYYSRLVQDLGFSCIDKYTTLVMQHDSNSRAYFQGIADKLGQAPDVSTYQFIPLSGEEWLQNLEEYFEITGRIFSESPVFASISLSDFRLYLGEMVSQRLCPHTSMRVVDQQGKMIAYLLSYPNYGPLLEVGSMTALKSENVSFHTCFDKLPRKMQIGKTVGILPEYRGQKLQHLITAHSALRGLDKCGYTAVTMAMMREGNKSERTHPSGLSTQTRRYSLYAKPLTGSPANKGNP